VAPDHYRVSLSTDGGSDYDTLVETTSPAPARLQLGRARRRHHGGRIQVEALDGSGDVLAAGASNSNFTIVVTDCVTSGADVTLSHCNLPPGTYTYSAS